MSKIDIHQRLLWKTFSTVMQIKYGVGRSIPFLDNKYIYPSRTRYDMNDTIIESFPPLFQTAFLFPLDYFYKFIRESESKVQLNRQHHIFWQCSCLATVTKLIL